MNAAAVIADLNQATHGPSKSALDEYQDSILKPNEPDAKSEIIASPKSNKAEKSKPKETPVEKK